MKKTAMRMLSAILVAVLLFFCMPVSATDTHGVDVDFSRPDGSKDMTLSPSELLEMLFPSQVSREEKEFADAYFQRRLVYDDTVSPTSIDISHADAEGFTVRAQKVSYTAQNGVLVVWEPVLASYGEPVKTHSLDAQNAYECRFDYEESRVVYVEYRCRVELSASFVSSLANFAYLEASIAKQNEDKYLRELDEYGRKKAIYDAYVEARAAYDEQVIKYDEYLDAVAAWEIQYKKYTDYLDKKQKYDVALARYQAYESAYRNYENAVTEYDALYDEYMAQQERYRNYLATLNGIRSSMTAIESLFVRPTNGVRPLYNALQNGELVTMIEKYDDKLVSLYGVKKDDITQMREVSDELNVLLQGYEEARKVDEKSAFAYYKLNYDKICQKFNFLYDKLSTILTDRIYNHVCAWIELEYDAETATYRKWRIRNVLCHIYLICRSLDDASSAGSTWTFFNDAGRQTVYNYTDLLSQNVILTDTNCASPASLSWQEECRPPKALPPYPTAPEKVNHPGPAPDEITEPEMPDEVTAPADPPVEVENPTAPKRIISRADGLIELYKNGTMSRRQVSGASSLELYTSVSRPFSVDTQPITVYFDYTGAVIGYNEPEQTPARPSTNKYDYSFTGWREESGDGYVFYYPVFESSLRTFEVVFKANADSVDALYSCRVEYGQIPQFVGEMPTKEMSASETFTFEGWYPPVQEVYSNTEYIAQFSSEQRLYSVKWSIHGEVIEQRLALGASPIPPYVPTESYTENARIAFVGWDKEVTDVRGDVTYTAVFEQTVLARPDTDADVENDVVVNREPSGYVVLTSYANTNIKTLVEHAKKENAKIEIVRDGVSLSIDADTARLLSAYGVAVITVDTATDACGKISYKFTDAQGNSVRIAGGIKISVESPFNADASLYVSCTTPHGAQSVATPYVSDGIVTFVASPENTYEVKCYRKLSISCSEGGTSSFTEALLREGEIPDIRIVPDDGFTVVSVKLVDSDGGEQTIDTLDGFIMPDKDVSISIEFEKKTYTVKFVTGNTVISEKQYALGDSIEIPDVELSYVKDGFLYTFIGWSENVSVVSGDATVFAKYSSISIEEYEENLDTQSAIDVVVKEQLIPASAIVVSIGGAVAVAIVAAVRFTKIRKKRKDVGGEYAADGGEEK